MRVVSLFTSVLACTLTSHAQVSLSADTGTTIFQCKIDGVTAFSDRPCGDDAESRTLDPAAINTYAPPAVSFAKQPEPKAPRAKATREDRSEAKRREACARYAKGLKDIRSKMRAGYTAKEGERLRVRAEKLRDSQREDRCR